MAWWAAAKLSLSAQDKEFCWAEGRLGVCFPYLKNYKEVTDVNEPLLFIPSNPVNITILLLNADFTGC